MHWPKSFAVVALTTAFTASVPSSDPVGVYAIVDRVVVEAGANTPATIQIWGAFALSDGRPGSNYQTAQCGYLYYTVNPRNERATRAEWSDLLSLAESGAAVGFGGRFERVGRVRTTKEKASGPDTYPLGIGVIKIGDRAYAGTVKSDVFARDLKAIHATCK